MPSSVTAILARLRALATPESRAFRDHLKASCATAVGVPIPALRALAREVPHTRELATALWATGVHEARLLAGYVCPPEDADEALAEAWVADFNTWDLCDQVMDLFCKASFGWKKAVEWTGRPEEFVRRTGFAMFCWFAVHDKGASDAKFVRTCFPLIRRHAADERNFVKKAVNWALRNIGKRNAALHEKAIALAEELAASDNKTERWIGKDALRELKSDPVRKRILRKPLHGA